jgi:hypothetical protein
VQKPFLLSDHVSALVARVYSASSPEESNPNDLFRLYMICAVSAVPLRRRGSIEQHPYSYFLAAKALIGRVNLVSGLEAMENLILLARFGVYYSIGMSMCLLHQAGD